MDIHVIKVFTPKVQAHPRDSSALGYTRFHELLKLPPRGKPLLNAIHKGFPVKILRDVAGSLSLDVYKLGTYIDIKAATLNRRLHNGTLTTAESDRLYRFIEVYDSVLNLFEGDKALANQWLNSPAVGLGGDAPISVVRISTGANYVMSMISKIEYGVLI